MLSLLTTVLALGANVVKAAPTTIVPLPEAIGSSTYSLPALKNTNLIRNGTAALLKAYAKHNLKPTMPMPESFMTALQKRQDGSVPAYPTSGVEYLVPATIGGQSLNLDLDTGSSDLWVFSSLLPESDRAGHSYYDSSKSTTYSELSNYTWSISYNDGSGASGVVGTDTVKLGGTIVKDQSVELANTVSSGFASGSSDGVLGLALSKGNTVLPEPQLTFFDNAKSSLALPLFAAYLPYNADGAYDFGYVDSTKFTGTIQYTPVIRLNSFWSFKSEYYKVGSTEYLLALEYKAIADTGTTLLLMGDAAVSTYYSQVSGSSYSYTDGGYIFPCSATPPSLSVKIGQTNYATIPGSLMAFAYAAESGQCYGSLQSVGVGGNYANIYGDVFFNANYAVFSANATAPTFGFAPIK